MIKIIVLLLFSLNVFATQVPTNASLKMIKFKMSTNSSGAGQFDMLVPGGVGNANMRMIAGGRGWFETHNLDDYIKMSMVDVSNVLGLGSGTTVGTFYDSEVPSIEQGWYIPPSGILEVDNLTSLVSLVGGLYLRIEVQTGDSVADTFRGNIIWGKEN